MPLKKLAGLSLSLAGIMWYTHVKMTQVKTKLVCNKKKQSVPLYMPITLILCLLQMLLNDATCNCRCMVMRPFIHCVCYSTTAFCIVVIVAPILRRPENKIVCILLCIGAVQALALKI